uniref:DUF1127 domain-containing protein n=1 Tax=Mycena chlorophos TaxID=658473 RepID=A0ABQ0LYK8_MYCCL|nr:predicted protein [Mycena chlorophos]
MFSNILQQASSASVAEPDLDLRHRQQYALWSPLVIASDVHLREWGVTERDAADLLVQGSEVEDGNEQQDGVRRMRGTKQNRAISCLGKLSPPTRTTSPRKDHACSTKTSSLHAHGPATGSCLMMPSRFSTNVA